MDQEKDVEQDSSITNEQRKKNRRCFEGKVMTVTSMLDIIKFLVTSWSSIHPLFKGTSIDSIICNWKEVAGTFLLYY